MSHFLLVTVVSVIGLAILQVGAFVVGRRIGRYNVADVVWGPGFALVAWLALLFGEGDNPRTWLIAVLVSIWAGRLALHVGRKTAGKGEDPRYEEMLDRSGGSSTALVVRKIFLTQLAAQWFISLPIQVSAVAGPTSGFLGVIVVAVGLLLVAGGIAVEAIGDRQLDEFKADPDNKGTIMDRGLWSWTRHPNYFGDACVWWGIWVIAASKWPGVLTVLSPALMTYFLVFATGARLLEKSMSKRDGWDEYASRTSFFIPRPPRKR